MIIVVAMNYRDFRDWCARHELHEGPDVIYASDVSRVRGLRGFEVRRTQNAYLHPLYRQIMQELR